MIVPKHICILIQVRVSLDLCSPVIYFDFAWKVKDDIHDSVQFPIIMSEIGQSVVQQENPVYGNWTQSNTKANV